MTRWFDYGNTQIGTPPASETEMAAAVEESRRIRDERLGREISSFKGYLYERGIDRLEISFVEDAFNTEYSDPDSRLNDIVEILDHLIEELSRRRSTYLRQLRGRSVPDP